MAGVPSMPLSPGSHHHMGLSHTRTLQSPEGGGSGCTPEVGPGRLPGGGVSESAWRGRPSRRHPPRQPRPAPRMARSSASTRSRWQRASPSPSPLTASCSSWPRPRTSTAEVRPSGTPDLRDTLGAPSRPWTLPLPPLSLLPLPLALLVPFPLPFPLPPACPSPARCPH